MDARGLISSNGFFYWDSVVITTDKNKDEGSVRACLAELGLHVLDIGLLTRTERPDRSTKSWLIDIRWKDRVKFFKAAPDLKRLGLRVDDSLTKEGRAERSRLRPMWQVIKAKQWIPMWRNGAELSYKKSPNRSAPVPYPSQYSDDDSDSGEGGEMDAENDDDVNMPFRGCAGGVGVTGSGSAAAGGSMPPPPPLPPPPPPPKPMAPSPAASPPTPPSYRQQLGVKNREAPVASLSAVKAKGGKHPRTEPVYGLMYSALPSRLDWSHNQAPAPRDPRPSSAAGRTMDIDGFVTTSGRRSSKDQDRDGDDLDQLTALQEFMGLPGDADPQGYTDVPGRRSEDLVCNFAGQQLGALCQSQGLLVLNGHVSGDLEGRLTFPKGEAGHAGTKWGDHGPIEWGLQQHGVSGAH
ncbi:hypothetical protein VOLCADRAFT_93002 [Volvox carteri f. nagariensis]|uniref:Uncharacterized protein n=1 Tax=Volvox carteri f. nagariensis TaxID=3068 RepID=D8U129_VOLCA|nr:uncharacterized protein VOLCADRAFT_93002 [Volvox carteri f. nagariensis]EFJ46486.1 hypothetical protein VOLCADRAFT_93002 [Volvox carteri f. nagariensis]|eukprot:XP_002952343.1 hypothetical protein VOLCADRAFT_93002 [Volvox carteri f. nagariensis]